MKYFQFNEIFSIQWNIFNSMFLGRALPDNRESHSQFQLVPSTSLLALFKMAEMADAVEEIPSYLSSVLDEADALLNNQSVDINSLEMHVVVLDRTVSFLRAVSEMDTEDQCDLAFTSFFGCFGCLTTKDLRTFDKAFNSCSRALYCYPHGRTRKTKNSNFTWNDRESSRV